MNVEKELKQVLKDETVDADTLKETFVEFIFENHEVKEALASITLCDESYGEAFSCLTKFKQMWMDMLSRGEDPHVGIAWEDNDYQRLWDCFGDVYGNVLTAQMEILTLQKTKTSLEYKILFIQNEEMLSYLGRINSSKDRRDINNAIFYLKELKKVTEGLIALEQIAA